MTSSIEYRSVIKFLPLRNIESVEIIQQLQEAYAKSYKWMQLFKSGHQSVFDQEKEGKQTEISDRKKICVKKIITVERRITIAEHSQRL